MASNINNNMNGFIASIKLGKYVDLLESLDEEVANGNMDSTLNRDREDLNEIIRLLHQVL
jgi:hypothetical protein